MKTTITRIATTTALAAIAVAAFAFQPDAAFADAPDNADAAAHQLAIQPSANEDMARQTVAVDPLLAVAGLAAAGGVMATAAIGMRRK
jgi:hypothetical protein